MPDIDLDQLQTIMPFAHHLGITFTAASAQEVVATLDWQPHLTTAGGILHGGALMTFADATGAALAYLNLPPNTSTTTTNSNTNLLRAATGGTLTATATAVKIGRTASVISTRITNADGKLVSVTTQTQQQIPLDSPS